MRRLGCFRRLVAAGLASTVLVACGATDGSGGSGGGSAADEASLPVTSAPAEDVGVPSMGPNVDRLPSTEVVLTSGSGDEVTVAARVAATDRARQDGLMGVREVPAGTGMLFHWDGERRDGGFWMKDTLVPLDIAFAGPDGEIVSILGMDPCEEEPCPTYRPGETYVAALEVPGGWFSANGVQEGDELSWSEPVDR
jgi:uncharacterized protein